MWPPRLCGPDRKRTKIYLGPPPILQDCLEGGRRTRGTGEARATRVASALGAPETRRLICYWCLEVGHLRDRCISGMDRSARCFRCDDRDHRWKGCTAASRCALCIDLGRPAGHFLRDIGCAPRPPKKRRKGAPLSKPGSPAEEPGPLDTRTGRADSRKEGGDSAAGGGGRWT